MQTLLMSRKFWATLLTLVVIVVATVAPNFELDSEAAAGLAVVAVSYIIGVAVDPGPGGWRGVVKSRKFYAAVFGFAVMFLEGFGVGLPFGLTQAHLVEIAVVIGAYIGGVSLEGKLPSYNPSR